MNEKIICATENDVEVAAPLTEFDVAAEIDQRVFVASTDAHGKRLDKCLATWVPELSRSYLTQLILMGCVQVQGKVVIKPSSKVGAGQAVDIELRPTPEATAFVPEALELNIVFEDPHILVINKPAGLVVHPGAGNWSGTVLNGLLHHHRGAAELPRAGIVHRLDKDTSGLMVVAKTREAMAHLVQQLAERTVQRIYVAIASGRGQVGSEYEIDQPIARDPKNRLRMGVVPNGKPAQTHARVLASGDGCVLMRCKLKTGRTHQIRVHLAWRGFPLIGDTLYGGRVAWGMSAQALHAHDLALQHPATGESMHWWAPPPSAWRQAALQAGLEYNEASLL